MTERDWIKELEKWLQASFSKACKAMGQPVPFSGLRINPPLTLEESKYFLLGLEANLFYSNEFGFIQSHLLPVAGEENRKEKGCRIFWHDSLPPRLVRESICQLSTAAGLILKRGWLASHIEVEPELGGDRDMLHGIDILVRSRTGQILACVEIKRTIPELQKLMNDLRACCTRGPHDKGQCGFPQNHPNYEFCAQHKPVYFWAVTSGAEVCFRMTHDNGSIGLEQLSSLPPRSMIESQ